ncbi:MAG: hypothetical protein LBR14_00190 [Clostridiales Family XIII bacterium]|nr:hypothetical protein [Clostridiales Family XIII bacterium]
MKHIFLINPAAGKGKAADLIPQILQAVKGESVDYEIHRTMNAYDAQKYVRERCERDAEPMRFYACGGDGTVNEVVNGLYGFPQAEIAVVPVGSGNDFVRNFDNREAFLDIGRQLAGSASPVDVIRYELLDPDTGEEGRGVPRTGVALNMYNMGFDAQVATKAGEIKGPVLKGSLAYFAGVGIILARMKPVTLSVRVDGQDLGEADYLLAGVANGRFSGGGFDGMPLANIRDGKMDVILVRNVTRRFFLSIVKKYHDGQHMDEPKLKGILYHYPCEEAEFIPATDMQMVIDGEPARVGGVRFRVEPGSVMLSVPV